MIIPLTGHIVTSNYGNRILNDVPQFHDGIDFISKDSPVVMCPTTGEVIKDYDNYAESNRWKLGTPDSAGNYVITSSIINGVIYYLYFFHLIENYVKIGDWIEEEQVIGIYGDVGYSFGAHLHFGVRDKNWKVVDPNIYFKIGGVKI